MAEPLINNSVYLKSHITERKNSREGETKNNKIDSDFAADSDTHRSVTGYVMVELELNNLNSTLSRSAVTPVFPRPRVNMSV